MRTLVAVVYILSHLALSQGQQPASYTDEEHPPLTIHTCTTAKGCVTEAAALTLEADWRWLHPVDVYDTCKIGSSWDHNFCPDNQTCAATCGYEGLVLEDYAEQCGVSTSDDAVTIQYTDRDPYEADTSGRLLLMASQTKYKLFHLLNQEISFDVNASTIACGALGALTLVAMEEDGGMSQHPGNKAGAEYGTGYCDSLCRATDFINGEANLPNAPYVDDNGDYVTDPKRIGQCCAQVDLWRGDRFNAVFVSHPSNEPGVYTCHSDQTCGYDWVSSDGVTSKIGCVFDGNANAKFYGPGASFTIDSTKPVTVVTQFITDDGTATGALVAIRRAYKQDGKVIANTASTSGARSITDAFCDSRGSYSHKNHGGLASLGRQMQTGMVLALSLRGDLAPSMGPIPYDTPPSPPPEGKCDAGNGDRVWLKTQNISVTFSNLRVGDIGSTSGLPSTIAPDPETPAPTTASPPEPTPSSAVVPIGGQCGGDKWTGATTCERGATCVSYSKWYSQCMSAATKDPNEENLVPRWGQCGGMNWNGKTACLAGTCVKVNDYYSQCQ